MRTSILLILLVLTGASSCNKFEFEEESRTFFHVKAGSTEPPVLVRGNTLSRKFILFINGGPGLTTLDVAHIDIFKWSEILEKSATMVYYDQRGTGNAPGDIQDSEITIDEYLSDINSILVILKEKYDNPDIYLMGHSFGGFIGQKFLLSNVEQGNVKGWINVNGSTILDVDTEWQYRRRFLIDIANEMIAKSEDVEKWQNALTWTEANDPITTREQKKEWRDFIGFECQGVIPCETVPLKAGDVLSIMFASSYNLFPAYLSGNLSKVGKLLYEDAKGTNLLEEVHRISKPSLFIWGKYDDLVNPQLGMEAFDTYGTPDIEKSFHLFEDSGHQPFITEPDRFQNLILDFVENN